MSAISTEYPNVVREIITYVNVASHEAWVHLFAKSSNRNQNSCAIKFT